jgi:hypothetical protein
VRAGIYRARARTFPRAPQALSSGFLGNLQQLAVLTGGGSPVLRRAERKLRAFSAWYVKYIIATLLRIMYIMLNYVCADPRTCRTVLDQVLFRAVRAMRPQASSTTLWS